MSMADDVEYYLGNEPLAVEPPLMPNIPNPPLLVCDIDGVLNTRPGSLDLDKVDQLAHICRMTGCQIVLSSSWRTAPHQLLRLNRVFRYAGIRMVGMTPDLTYQIGKTLLAARLRWEEIKCWLDQHGHRFSKVVILDDLADMGPLQPLLVQTESHVGLTAALADQIINLLH